VLPGVQRHTHESKVFAAGTTFPAQSVARAPLAHFDGLIKHMGEEDKRAVIDVFRMGDLTRRSTLTIKTRDGTALANIHYHPTTALLEFLPREHMKSLSIPLLGDSNWGTVLQFSVLLCDENCENIQISDHSSTCIVEIVDDDAFPTNKCRPNTQGEHAEITMRKRTLFIEFWKMALQDKVFRNGVKKWMIVDVVHNLYYGLTLVVKVHAINLVVDTKNSMLNAAPKAQLVVIAIFLVLPNILLHYFDYRKCFWKVGGSITKRLSSNLIIKFMNLSSRARIRINNGKLLVALKI